MTDESQPTPPEDLQPDSEADEGEAAGSATESEHIDNSEPVAQTSEGASDSGGEPHEGGADEEFSADAAAAMAESLLAEVTAAVSDANAGTEEEGGAAHAPGSDMPSATPAGAEPMNLPGFESAHSPAIPAELDLLADVNLNVKIELGRTRLLVDDVLKLNEGAVVELDKLAGDPVDIYVNERHVARGEVLVLNDNFCVRINEIVEPEKKHVV